MSVSVWIRFWVKPLRGQLAPVCKNNRVFLIVSGMGLMFGQLFVVHPLSLCSIPHAYISCRQDKFWVKSVVGRLVSLLFHWGSCLETGGWLFRFHSSSVVSHSLRGHLHWFLGSSLIQVSVSSWRCPPPPHPHQLQISIHFHGYLAISPVLPDTRCWIPTVPFPSSSLPVPFLPPSKWDSSFFTWPFFLV